MTIPGTAAAAFIVILIGPAFAAGQTVDATLDQAIASAKAGRTDQAAAGFGRAAALAHKANDPLGEQRVADELRRFLGGAKDRPTAIAGVIAELDPKRLGAFVAAGPLAAEVLMLATRAGTTAKVAEASKVLAAQEAAPKCGRAIRVLATYAKALQLVAQRKPADAVPLLDETLATAAGEGWVDVSFHAGTELAVQALAAGRPPQATAALTVIAGLFPAGTDQDHVQTWRNLVGERLMGAPADVLAPFEEAMKRFGRTSMSAAGGAGGHPASISKLGSAWPKLSPETSLVTAKRLDDGFDVVRSFESKAKVTQPLGSGLKHQSGSGITLGFHGRGVALEILDLDGRAGQPGESSYLPSGLALYRLAKGETWTVTRQGIVSITAP